MTYNQSELPKSAVKEFEKTSAMKWDGGVLLDELLVRVNRVAAKMVVSDQVGDSRVSATFQPRTFRHYVALGCIDQGAHVGRGILYGYRQFVQALLVRRLLSERVPARRIPELMTGMSIEETKKMLFGGVEMVARQTDSKVGMSGGAEVNSSPEAWLRAEIAPGVELHLQERRQKLKPSEIREVLAAVEKLLKMQG